jgi:hypothetical protein
MVSHEHELQTGSPGRSRDVINRTGPIGEVRVHMNRTRDDSPAWSPRCGR